MAATHHFEGEKTFRQSPAEIWAKLTDARFLLGCLPDVEAVLKNEPDMVTWKMRPGFSFVRGTLETTLRIAERAAGQSARYEVHSKGIGSSSAVEAQLTMTPVEDGTQVRWTAEIKELGGLLKAVPSGLIKASAQKVITDAWAAIEAKLLTPESA